MLYSLRVVTILLHCVSLICFPAVWVDHSGGQLGGGGPEQCRDRRQRETRCQEGWKARQGQAESTGLAQADPSLSFPSASPCEVGQGCSRLLPCFLVWKMEKMRPSICPGPSGKAWWLVWLASALTGPCSVIRGQNKATSGESHHRTWHRPLSQR